MYRFLRKNRSFRGIGSADGYCPVGYGHENGECVPNWADCKTPSGDHGELDDYGNCIYIPKALPGPGTGPVTKPSTGASTKPSSSTPVSTSQGGAPAGAPSNYLQPCKTPSGLPGVIGYFGECFYQGAGDPCGNGGIYDALGNCINEKAAPVVTKPVDLPANVPMSKSDRDAECRKYYGSNSGAVFYNGVWSCNVCDKDEVLDPSDNLCMCKSGTMRKTPGDTMSPCVPKVNLQPVAQAGFDLKPLAVAAAGILAAVLIYSSFKKEEPS